MEEGWSPATLPESGHRRLGPKVMPIDRSFQDISIGQIITRRNVLELHEFEERGKRWDFYLVFHDSWNLTGIQRIQLVNLKRGAEDDEVVII